MSHDFAGFDRTLGDQELLHHLVRQESGAGVSWQLDPNGTVPCYMVKGGNSVSPSPLALAIQNKLEPQPHSCASFLINGVYYDGGSFHPDLEVLPPGSSVREMGQKTEVLSPDPLLPWRNGSEPTVERLIEATMKAVEPLRNLRVVCDLTGGFDSRLVASALVAAGIPFTGAVTGEVDSPDVVIAGRLADHFGVDLIHDTTTVPDDPAIWRRALVESGGTVGVRQAARLLAIQEGRTGRFDVSVGGLGGEMLRALWWLHDPIGLDSHEDPDWVRFVRYRIFQSPFPLELLKGGWRDAIKREESLRINWFKSEVAGQALDRKRDKLDYAYLRLHFTPWLRSSMATSLRRIKIHNPLLDPAVLGIALSIGTAQRRSGLLLRQAITRLDKGAARMPMASGGTALPLSPLTPWRFLPVAKRLAQGAWRRFAPGRTIASQPSWGDRPLDLTMLTEQGILAADAVESYRRSSGSLAHLERLQTLELLFRELKRT